MGNDFSNQSGRRGRHRGVAVVLCVWSVLLLGLGLDASPASAKPLQIVLLGDSITASEPGRRSYRYYLWRRLVDEKLEFDFVGTQHLNDDGPGYWPRYKNLRFDPDHEGHAKWRIDHVVNGKDDGRGNLASWLDSYTPDVAVVMLGTHDALQAKETEWSQREMRRVIEALRVDNDRVAILLVTPPPAKHENAAYLDKLAAMYADLAESETTVNSPVRLVDLHGNFDPDRHLAYDGTQPNDAGEREIATQVASALLLLDDSHLDPVRRTAAQAWGSVLVVPLGAALGFFLLARSQLKRERAASTYHLLSRGGQAGAGLGGGGGGAGGKNTSGRASRVSAASDGADPMVFPGKPS